MSAVWCACLCQCQCVCHSENHLCATSDVRSDARVKIDLVTSTHGCTVAHVQLFCFCQRDIKHTGQDTHSLTHRTNTHTHTVPDVEEAEKCSTSADHSLRQSSVCDTHTHRRECKHLAFTFLFAHSFLPPPPPSLTELPHSLRVLLLILAQRFIVCVCASHLAQSSFSPSLPSSVMLAGAWSSWKLPLHAVAPFV